MWIVVGNSEKTEFVQGGRRCVRTCDRCGESAVFYERRVTRSLQIFWIDVYDYEKKVAMACGACGALYATDELGAVGEPEDQESFTAKVGDAAERAGKAIERGAERVAAWIRGEPSEKNPDENARESAAADEPAQPSNASRSEDPLDDEERKLNARFEELERKARERKSPPTNS